MYVVLTHKNAGVLGYMESLTNHMRMHWGQRGIAMHVMDYQQTAKEAALAANYHVRHYQDQEPMKEEEIIPPALFNAVWAGFRSSDGNPDFWAKIFMSRSKQETQAWRDNGLVYVIVLTGVKDGTEFEVLKPFLGSHMKMSIGWPDADIVIDPRTELSGDWVQTENIKVFNEYQRRLRVGFE